MVDPRFIPDWERAEGEPGEGALTRAEAEEQEAADSAPEILDMLRERMRDLPRLVEARKRHFSEGPLVFLLPRDHEASIIEELRAPLRTHFTNQLRAGRWICFGFSEALGERVQIRSPWRKGLEFEAAGATDEQGRKYSEVLFYRAEMTPAKSAARADKKKLMTGRGNTDFDDEAVVALVRAEYAKMPKRSKAAAATKVIDEQIANGLPIQGASREAWIDRIRRQI